MKCFVQGGLHLSAFGLGGLEVGHGAGEAFFGIGEPCGFCFELNACVVELLLGGACLFLELGEGLLLMLLGGAQFGQRTALLRAFAVRFL